MSSNDPKPTRAEREWQRRHRDILDAATGLFMDLGPGGTTMQMIAERAEYSVGYIYKHFPGKDELVDEIFSDQIEFFADVRNRVHGDLSLSPLARLRRELSLVCEHMATHSNLMAIVKAQAGHLAEKKRALFAQRRQEDVALFQEAKDTGEIGSGDPALLAASYNGAIHGLLQWIHDSGQPERFTEIPEIVDQLILAPLEAAGTEPNGKARTK